MKKYDVLLFDVDGTLLDFDRAEEMGIEGLLEHYGVPVTAENKESTIISIKATGSAWSAARSPGTRS